MVSSGANIRGRYFAFLFPEKKLFPLFLNIMDTFSII